MSFEKYYEARNIIKDFLLKDLIGPIEIEEVINEYPSQYYCAGIIYPKDLNIKEEDIIEKDDSFKKDELGSIDNFEEPASTESMEEIPIVNSFKPSSLAISTTIKPGVKNLKIHVTYAKYRELDKGEVEKFLAAESEKGLELEENTSNENIDIQITDEKNEENIKKEDKSKWQRSYWKREPKEKEIIVKIENDKFNSIAIEDDFFLKIFFHKKFIDDSKIITFALVNEKIAHKKSISENEKQSFFQICLTISSAIANEDAFSEMKQQIELIEDDELQTLNMLYSEHKNFVVGHGCSVKFNFDNNHCTEISTAIIPEFDYKPLIPALKVEGKLLDAYFLATGEKSQIIKELKKIEVEYAKWINSQRELSKSLEKKYHKFSEKNLDECEITLGRIKKALSIMAEDVVFKAFQLANKAMLIQKKDNIDSLDKLEDIKFKWFPFQIAFILQEIEAIADNSSEFKDTVDLLWFPTGGGKTEAYLGLSAFVIFLRRLQSGQKGSGVTVLMRYTLRLLTIQQFQRASALICACEYLRRKENLPGEEISIGLFVGGDVTPNNIEVAKVQLEKIKANEIVNESNPCQVLRCPFCGEAITYNAYAIRNNSLNINCPNSGCEFNKGLPIYVVDEDIFNIRPTFIVSTIDKFARITWEPKIGSIFNINTDFKPPELIIQDELHLISGPLGTISGLYEVALDRLLSEKGNHPKIVASTATIKNASKQIKALYGREFKNFPPQGIDIKDSFFAEILDKNETYSSRKYMGILVPGKTQDTILIRVLACLQFATRYLIDLKFDDEIIDNFWTITGYFNTLRELGSAVPQIHDNIQERFKYLYKTKFKNSDPPFNQKKEFNFYVELTSRVGSGKIIKTLEKINRSFKSGDALDYILASNMISVGIDIYRLGLMAIYGQPKSNSEYVQATGRIGRNKPGLIITIYSAFRSRDRSFYEQFVNFHGAIYKFIEASSVTPFSARALDRALHAVYIGLCRQLIVKYRENSSAGNFNEDDKDLMNVEDFILDKVKSIDFNNSGEVSKNLNTIKKEWTQQASEGSLMYSPYGSKDNTDVKTLLKSNQEDDGIFLTLNSMRNVDEQSSIYIIEDEGN